MSEAKQRGYIKLYRKQFDEKDILWGDKTVFDSRSAWVWLLQSAAFRDGVYHTAFRVDELKRGEFVASLRYLGEAWKWSHTRVRRFLQMLSSEKVKRLALQRKGQHGAVYLIVNYDSYQSGNLAGVTPLVTPADTPAQHPRNKVEEGKEGKEDYTADFELLWKAYPKRHGGSNKAGSYSRYLKHLRDGVSFDIMFEGVKRYALLCISDGSVGTRFVKDCETFLGPKKCFLDDHTPGKADTSGVLPISREERREKQFKQRGYVT